MGVIKWLDHKLPDGLYRGKLRGWLERCELWLSLCYHLQMFVKGNLKIQEGEKVPEWVAELYQLFSLLVGIVLLIVAQFVPDFLHWAILIPALYRPFEILLFAVNWIFVHTGPLHSYKRSLAGFGVNILELVVYFAAAYLSSGCIQSPTRISTALYSSLRTLVTIGPIGTSEPPISWFCGALIMAQILIAYFLTIVIVANVVGALRRREREGKTN